MRMAAGAPGRYRGGMSTSGDTFSGPPWLQDSRARVRRKRAVVEAVRKRSRGRDRADVEADLVNSFASEGIPQLPEYTKAQAELIAGGIGTFGALGMIVDAFRGKRLDGVRPEKERLDGARWVGVAVADDPSARSTLRSWAIARAYLRRHVTLPQQAAYDRARLGPWARLTVVQPTDSGGRPQVGVFLGSNFVGTLPAVEADVAGLWTAIQTSEAADRRLTVQSRLDPTGPGEGAYTMSVALP
jgi:hypothetical protein